MRQRALGRIECNSRNFKFYDMKKYLETLRIIGFIVAIIISLCPQVYNLMNPDITQMRLFLMFWWVYVIAIGLLFVSIYKWK